MPSTHLRLTFLLLLASATAHAADAPAAVKFDRVTGEANGTAAAFSAWHKVEMERQGGPGKQSHGWWPWGLRAADFDNDGVPDLLPSHHGTPHSIVLRGTRTPAGTLTFADVTKQFGVDGRDLPWADDRPWVWDFDGDGFLDLAGFSDEATSRAAFNAAGKRFVPFKDDPFKSLAHPREVVDLNGDGYLDVDGGSKGQWFYVPDKKTFRRDPAARFAPPAGVPEGVVMEFAELKKVHRFFGVDFLTHNLIGYDTVGYDPRPIDLDGDGRGDVVVSGSGGYGAAYAGRYLIRQADDKLVDRTAELGLPTAGAAILVRDLTGDGLPEVLIVSNKSGGTDGGLFVNSAGGKFRRADGPMSNFLDRRGPYVIRAYPADFDNDGRTDLVLSNPRMGMAAVYHNQGDGRFAEVLKLSGCWDSNPAVVADLDADGRTDLAVGLRAAKDSPGEIQLFLNRSPNPGHFASIAPRMAAPNPFAVGAVVEVFAAGQIGSPTARPLAVEKARLDGSPILTGLGEATRCDVRVTFPGGRVVERKSVEAGRPVTIAP
ncbi:MAG TPA: VCBS repeat-containing protein [Tepidisphaeraceae bacterium]|nr:VCBS repeat-containing protein [Tepidisphaeraceae bacterium]